MLKYSLYSERRDTLRPEGEIPGAGVTVWDAKSPVTICCFLNRLNIKPKSETDNHPFKFRMILMNCINNMVTAGSLNTVRSKRNDNSWRKKLRS